MSGSALDADSNTLTDASRKQYTWDFENRWTAFKYDPFGRRIQKSGPLGTTNYLYDGPNLLEEVDQSGSVLARYTQGKGIDEPLAQLRSGTTSYDQADGLGSITSLSSPSGTTGATYNYDAFGNLSASTGSLTNSFRYTAREFDSETSLYYYRARYYDSSTSRFLSEDPMRFDSRQANFYAYVRNSPLNNLDPTGLALCVLTFSGRSAWLYCLPDDPRHKPVFFPAASGNNGEESHCKNDPACVPNENQGPIPLGWWYWTGRHGSGHGKRELLPVPGTGTNDTEGRTDIYSHWCDYPFGPSEKPGKGGHYCSEGCVTAYENDINALNNLLDSEPDSQLYVTSQ